MGLPKFGEIVERLRPLPSFEPSSNEPTPGPGLPDDPAIQRPRAGLPGDQPDSSAGHCFDHGHDTGADGLGESIPGGHDDSEGMHWR
jgi:hypothetical protein